MQTPTHAEAYALPSARALRVGMRETATADQTPASVVSIDYPQRSTKWLEGGAVGAVIGGAGALLLRSAGENHREVEGTGSRVITALSGGAVGFLVGALVGNRIDR
ncbi:MAG TPA: hypothetical protein VFN22_09620 [Gemmatimonadales bacterium]|nr:hypothetical protein [Gemmatimonadales bacterium]